MLLCKMHPHPIVRVVCVARVFYELLPIALMLSAYLFSNLTIRQDIHISISYEILDKYKNRKNQEALPLYTIFYVST